MNQNTNQNSTQSGNSSIFSRFYRIRIHVCKGNITILNLSLLFLIFSLLCAPWLVLIGGIAALALGYRFSIEKNADSFQADFSDVVQNATESIKNAANSFTQNPENTGSTDSSTETDGASS